MLYFVYSFLYGDRLIFTVLITLLIPFVLARWGSKHERFKMAAAYMVVIVSVVLILVVTVFMRLPGEGVATLVLRPFETFEAAKIHSELYRVFAGNIMIFIPLGAGIVVLIEDKYKRAVPVAFLVCVLFSLAIEVTQYCVGIGQAEVDDLIANGAGGLIGAWIAAITTRKR